MDKNKPTAKPIQAWAIKRGDKPINPNSIGSENLIKNTVAALSKTAFSRNSVAVPVTITEGHGDELGWPAGDTKIEVFYLCGECLMVVGVWGWIIAEVIQEIESDLEDNPAEEFEQGDGTYFYTIAHNDGQYGEFGRCEIEPHWELTFVEFKPMPVSDKEATR